MPISVNQNRISAELTIAKDAYQLAREQDPGIGSREEWLASLKGEAGDDAYQVAVTAGFVGTVEEWLESLKGDPGQDADITGEIAGAPSLGTLAGTEIAPMLDGGVLKTATLDTVKTFVLEDIDGGAP